jgi:uncharacterized membrane protein YedE/YeeE
MSEIISQPWPWYVAGPLIALTMLSLLLFGKSFGISSNLRTLCSIGGAGKVSDFFRFEWKSQLWNLAFVGGTIIGGFIANTWLTSEPGINLSEETVLELRTHTIETPGSTFAPEEIFSWKSLTTPRGFIMLVIGGLLVGFGTRYADGCTSGHAISGLSNLQLPSFLAVIGFFIGGLVTTYLIFPFLLSL